MFIVKSGKRLGGDMGKQQQKTKKWIVHFWLPLSFWFWFCDRILCTGSESEFYLPDLGPISHRDPEYIDTLSNTSQ